MSPSRICPPCAAGDHSACHGIVSLGPGVRGVARCSCAATVACQAAIDNQGTTYVGPGPLEQHYAAVAAARDPAVEAAAERIAYGLWVLEQLIHACPTPADWRAQPDKVRSRFMDRGRFVLSCGGDLGEPAAPSDGHLDDAETWTPTDGQVVPPEVLALHRVDRVLGNERALSERGTGRARGLVLDALRDWHRRHPRGLVGPYTAAPPVEPRTEVDLP